MASSTSVNQHDINDLRHDVDDDDEKLNENDKEPPFTVAVIGGGWAGFSAADCLSSLSSTTTTTTTNNHPNNNNNNSNKNIQIHLLDASPRGPGGLAGGGWKTPQLGQPVEAGIHGFWREYRNTFAQMKRIGLDLDQVLTPYLPSLLVSSEGRVAVAPVLGKEDDNKNDKQEKEKKEEPASSFRAGATTRAELLARRIADALPPPLDIALLAEYDEDAKLTVADRLSALGLLGAWADFGQEDAASWDRYDAISADQLFRNMARISPRLFGQLVEPLLHVLPMTTAYDCSAAAALSCFHVFALQSRGAFDVRWCRGSIVDKIFDPWVQQLTARANVHIRGSARVTRMERIVAKKVRLVMNGNEEDTLTCDAVVLAVGATAAQRLIHSCPPLQAIPNLAQQWKDLRGVTCVAVRLFLDRAAMVVQPAKAILDALERVPAVTVCGPAILLPTLVETGFCLYDLSRLQDDFAVTATSNNAAAANNNNKMDKSVLALEVDYFRADTVAALSDDQVVELTWKAIQKVLLGSVVMETLQNNHNEPQPNNTKNDKNNNGSSSSMLLDCFVVRARNAVSHFCVGSAATSPNIRLSSPNIRLSSSSSNNNDNLFYMCGDWVDRKGHASWSTEKAVVTGRQAAAALAQDFGLLKDSSSSTNFDVIPAASDSVQLQALRQAAALWRSLSETTSILSTSTSRNKKDPNNKKQGIFPRAPPPPWT